MLKHKDLIDFTLNPFELFANWYDLAIETEINDPNAMTLSTISNNKPSSRVVLLKSHDEKGFVFYTNSNSKKGKSISENNNIALNFHWKTQNRQIRIEGQAKIVSSEIADSYFNSRPRGSQIGAWSSNQSAELNARSELIDNIKKFEKKYEDQDIPRPSHWNGYLVKPQLIEFWQEMPFRIHDRVVYTLFNNKWKIKKLYP
ncbi:pyridoxamine 5'-phosphate oxidase [Alphaproteobacteria bacterium]|jgi:pyridoxamine 5'-phosphate oxidase|nr:pyridoxamine 5'-phosphate oxidase [Alphaproteobacteria bacterium]|tara:strand:+ start:633 stop:1235 length:603 start_codon:yes stop_codon:yes gene_type:complete